ncbi:MAG: magnesium transporter CorA family protein [Ruminococcus sp.]|nr:magnesium transporter CorA family protein [Ruminococcus sp.]
MINIYKNDINHKVIKVEESGPGCWISVTAPTQKEVSILTENYGLNLDFIKSALDDEESSRTEKEDDQTLIIVDTPEMEVKDENTILYYTTPLSIIIKDKMVFTITLNTNTVIEDVINGRVKGINTAFMTKFILQLMLRSNTIYLSYLRKIDKASNIIEEHLNEATKNEEIVQLLELQKSLVYFSTSLKSNETTLNKIFRGNIIKLYEEDKDLLEDVLIENKQAMEMASIYSRILSGMMDAFSSVINNNLNTVMWRLTVITVILAVPTIVYSFYGMNTDLPLPYTWFPSIISVFAMVVVWIILINSKSLRK